MSRITLHVGAGKCGSSAIQVALSRRPRLKGAGGRTYSYTVIDHRGAVRSGRRLALGEGQSHVKSESLGNLRTLPPRTLRSIRSRLLRIGDPILSHEGMLSAPEACGEVIGHIGLPVRVIAYVRPQLEYLNSAWWQWGAWSRMPREKWIQQRIGRSEWHGFLARWAAIDEVEEVVVRLLPRDVVADILSVLGHPAEGWPGAPPVNSSLPAAALRFLQRNPDLRYRFGDAVDFRLPELLDGAGLAPTPWVIDQDLARRVIGRVIEGNRRLLGMLSPPDRVAMEADPRWWDATAFADRLVEPFEAPPAADPEMEAVAARLLEAALGPAPARRSRLATVLDLGRWRG